MAELMDIMKRSELEVERRLVDPLRQFLWRFSRVCPPAGPPLPPFLAPSPLHQPLCLFSRMRPSPGPPAGPTDVICNGM